MKEEIEVKNFLFLGRKAYNGNRWNDVAVFRYSYVDI